MATKSERHESADQGRSRHIAVTHANAERFEGVFKQLTLEHAQLLSLLLEAQDSDDLEERGALIDRVADDLVAHEEAERSTIYGGLRDQPQLASYADAHALDAESMQRVLHELQSIPAYDEAWLSTLDQLIALLQQHTRQEETEYFPVAQELVGHTANALHDAYRDAKAAVLRDLTDD